MAKCSRCGAYVSGFTGRCPKCGAEFANRFSLKNILIVIIVLLCLAVPAILLQKILREKHAVPPTGRSTNEMIE